MIVIIKLFCELTESIARATTGQYSFPQVSTEHSADKADQKDHQLRYKLHEENIYCITVTINFH